MQRMEYVRELTSSVLDLPWTVGDGVRRAARRVRRAGEALWSSGLDLPWLLRDAWKRLALIAAAVVLLAVPGMRYLASATATGDVAGAATPDRWHRGSLGPSAPQSREPRVRRPLIRARVDAPRAPRGRLHRERLALIDGLAANARRAARATR
jgi:hypothetical protein